MKEASKDIEHFFPHFTIGETRLSDLGYFPIFISIFDHWLSREECNASDILFYDEAVKTGKIGEYMVGENNFVAFYQHLARRGAYVHETVLDETGHLLSDTYWETDADDKDFIALLRVRLKEQRPFDGCCIYFPEFEVRYLSARDRTDLLLLRNKDLLPTIEKIAKEHHLHLLNADHLDELDEESEATAS